MLCYRLQNYLHSPFKLRKNELTRGTTEHIGTKALLGINFIWFGSIAHLSQWGGGGILLVQMISTWLCYAEEGGWGSAPCPFNPSRQIYQRMKADKKPTRWCRIWKILFHLSANRQDATCLRQRRQNKSGERQAAYCLCLLTNGALWAKATSAFGLL